MSHRPLHQWVLDSDGRPKTDSKGNRKLHPKAGQAKLVKEYTPGEARTVRIQEEDVASQKRREAQLIIDPIRDAEKLIGAR